MLHSCWNLLEKEKVGEDHADDVPVFIVIIVTLTTAADNDDYDKYIDDNNGDDDDNYSVDDDDDDNGVVGKVGSYMVSVLLCIYLFLRSI